MKETPFAGSIRIPITIALPDTPAPVALMGLLRRWIRFNGFAFIDRRVTFSHRCQVTFVELFIVPRQRIPLLLAIGMGIATETSQGRNGRVHFKYSAIFGPAGIACANH